MSQATETIPNIVFPSFLYIQLAINSQDVIVGTVHEPGHWSLMVSLILYLKLQVESNHSLCIVLAQPAVKLNAVTSTFTSSCLY